MTKSSQKQQIFTQKNLFRICKTSFFVELLKLFKQYCWNNFLHNYVKKCLVYGIQAFDTIPNSTQLVISALQTHVSIEGSLGSFRDDSGRTFLGFQMVKKIWQVFGR
jgi:SIT4 phosphatase-associated protein